MRIVPSWRLVIKLAVAAAADVQIGARRGGAIRLFDQLSQRHIRPAAARVSNVPLDLFDRRDRCWNAVIGLLQRRQIGGEKPALSHVAEHELATQQVDATVVGKAAKSTGLRRGRRQPPDR